MASFLIPFKYTSLVSHTKQRVTFSDQFLNAIYGNSVSFLSIVLNKTLHSTYKHRSPEYQYSETNVMHFLFSLLKIKGLYMYRALLAHPQEVLHKRHLVYCVRVMSFGCYQDWSGISFTIYQVPFV
jgi:hypothetical protein